MSNTNTIGGMIFYSRDIDGGYILWYGEPEKRGEYFTDTKGAVVLYISDSDFLGGGYSGLKVGEIRRVAVEDSLGYELAEEVLAMEKSGKVKLYARDIHNLATQIKEQTDRKRC